MPERINPGPEHQRHNPTLGELLNSKGRSGGCTMKSSTQWLKTASPMIMLARFSLNMRNAIAAAASDQTMLMKSP